MKDPDRQFGKVFRSGFTLTELLIVSMLMVAVVMMTAQFWRTYSVHLVDYVATCSVTQEARFVTESLAMDFGSAAGALKLDSDHLLICKDSGDYPNGFADWGLPDTLVEYYVSNDRLYRYDQSDGTDIVIASAIGSMNVSKQGTDFQITIDLQRRDVARQLTFFWESP